MTLTKRSISEDIAASEEYVTAADEFMFETGRYIEMNPIPHTTNAISATVKSHRISFRPMTHDDCHIWFMQLEAVFSSQGITSQITKFAALTTLRTEDEAYVVRDLTLMGDDRPMDVFDAAKRLFIHQYELTTATSPRLPLVDTTKSGEGYVETTIYSLCCGYHRWTVVQ